MAPAVTAPIESGFYSDALRVTIGPAMRATMWTRRIEVDADMLDQA